MLRSWQISTQDIVVTVWGLCQDPLDLLCFLKKIFSTLQTGGMRLDILSTISCLIQLNTSVTGLTLSAFCYFHRKHEDIDGIMLSKETVPVSLKTDQFLDWADLIKCYQYSLQEDVVYNSSPQLYLIQKCESGKWFSDYNSIIFKISDYMELI